MDKKTSKSYNEVLISFKNVIKGLNNIMPGAVIVGIILTITIIATSLISVHIMMAVVIIQVIGISTVVFVRTSNYGEASLALVAGLLPALTVEWTAGRFIVFTTTYIGFSLLVLIITSIRLAGKLESLYVQAAIYIDTNNSNEIRRELEIIGKSSSLKMIDPIERAECILQFAFKKIPVSSMLEALEAVEKLHVVTKIDLNRTTTFVTDLYKILINIPNLEFQHTVDFVFSLIRETPASPEEFFEAFFRTKKYALLRQMEVKEYFEELKRGLEKGLSPDEISDYIEK